ncbi:hypothetical protein VNI00_011251 [Paramarasmius palmivorus]|uniref:ABM domain-containing protein n=1 Tax=Paramarasmius palmivorus TaxID=297713 RepID=A0AAW0CE74_9AGAR
MATLPESLKNKKFIFIAYLTAADGKADEMQTLLADIRKFSNSNDEPGCLTYRTTRGVGEESNKFIVIEEYADEKAFNFHMSCEKFLALTKSGTIGDIKFSFSEEFQ